MVNDFQHSNSRNCGVSEYNLNSSQLFTLRPILFKQYFGLDKILRCYSIEYLAQKKLCFGLGESSIKTSTTAVQIEF